MLRKLDLNNNPYIGVFCRANEKMLIAPSSAHAGNVAKIAEALGIEIVPFSIGSCTLLGSLSCMNSNGVMLANMATKTEVARLSSHIRTDVLDHRLNALGNNVLVNDMGALVNPEYGPEAVNLLGDVLGVPITRGTIAGLNTVGACAAATNKGVLCHPHTTDKEMKVLGDALKVPVHIGTLNYGTAMIGACILANSKGAVVGSPTTTVEIGRVQEAFELF